METAKDFGFQTSLLYPEMTPSKFGYIFTVHSLGLGGRSLGLPLCNIRSRLRMYE